jgi:glycerol-3-phosphate dehydrogenase
MIYWACTEEMAVTLEDVLARRHRGLFLNAEETLRIAPEVAKLMAEYLGKNKKWVSEQLTAYEEVASTYLIP